MIKKCDVLYIQYKTSYNQLKSKVFSCAESVKYSAGGTIYPFGKYFFGESKIYRKGAKQSPGHFCKTNGEANFAYVFSKDRQLLAINQMFDCQKNSSGYVDYTSFLIYEDNYTYILKYLEYDTPELHEIGIMVSNEKFNVMFHSDAPCRFIQIVLRDEQNEYLYSLSREIFESKYPKNKKSNDIYADYWNLPI